MSWKCFLADGYSFARRSVTTPSFHSSRFACSIGTSDYHCKCSYFTRRITCANTNPCKYEATRVIVADRVRDVIPFETPISAGVDFEYQQTYAYWLLWGVSYGGHVLLLLWILVSCTSNGLFPEFVDIRVMQGIMYLPAPAPVLPQFLFCNGMPLQVAPIYMNSSM